MASARKETKKPTKKTRKRKKRTSSLTVKDAARVAAILAEANVAGDAATAAKFKVGERSIRRWRHRAETGDWPALAELTGKLRDAALDRCIDLLQDVYETALRQLKSKIPDASYREVLDTVTATGELKTLKDQLGENVPVQGNGQGSAGQAAQGTGREDSGAKVIRGAFRDATSGA